MKEYKYMEKRRVVKGKEYNVIIPEKHSTIEALIFETRDLNAWDSWANITNYHTTCLVLRKGEKEWETLHNGSTRSFKLNGIEMSGIGIFNVLFQLETKRIRNIFLKREEIKELKNEISRDLQRLKELEGEK